MHFSAVLATIGLAGLAFSAPVQLDYRALVSDIVVEHVTVYTTVWVPAPTSTPAAVAGAAAGINNLQQQASSSSRGLQYRYSTKSTSQAVATPAPTPQEEAVTTPTPTPEAEEPATTANPAKSSSATAAQSSTPVESSSSVDSTGNCVIPTDYSSSPVSCGENWLDSINKWRKIYKKSTLVWREDLAQLSLKAAQAYGGPSTGLFQHTDLEAAKISGGETMAGADIDPVSNPSGPTADYPGYLPLEYVMLKGWLCEVKGDAELAGRCSTTGNFVLEPGVTGHHDIMLSDDYKSVGCAYTSTPEITGTFVCNWGGSA